MTGTADDTSSMQERRPPIVSVFVDERIDGDARRHRLVVACVVVGAARWKHLHEKARRVGEVRRSRRLDEIAKLLAKIGSFALVTYGDLPAELVPVGAKGLQIVPAGVDALRFSDGCRHPDHATELFILLAVEDWAGARAMSRVALPRLLAYLLAYLVHWPNWPPGWNASIPRADATHESLELLEPLRGRGFAVAALTLTVKGGRGRGC